MKKVAICLICTGKYDIFLPQLLKSIEEKFLLNHKIEIHLFWDKPAAYPPWTHNRRMEFYIYNITSYKFPLATLMRYYEILRGNYKDIDYLYYMDVDMRVENEVGEEIFGDLVA
jgi:hypothetical protein